MTRAALPNHDPNEIVCYLVSGPIDFEVFHSQDEAMTAFADMGETRWPHHVEAVYASGHIVRLF